MCLCPDHNVIARISMNISFCVVGNKIYLHALMLVSSSFSLMVAYMS